MNQADLLGERLVEVDKSAWDLAIELDFAEGGAGATLLDDIRKDFKAGHCRKWV